MSTRLHWLWLATRASLPAHQIAALVERFGTAEQIYAADRRTLEEESGLTRQQIDALCDKSLDHAARISDDCERLGASILTMTDTAYPDRLRHIPAPPAVLYVRGTMPDLDALPCITIVGTRRTSAYGRACAAKIAKELAQAGFVIISGMASGIDGEANRAALRAGGRTVAVLGCGVDVCYPPHHQALMGDILIAGAVVSEYPPGTQPEGWHFPQRNRIMSGLSLGTLVIEAPARSGSLITARCALDQGRDVFVVPGNLGVPSFDGSNRMIADGEARLITSSRDIIREYTGLLRTENAYDYNEPTSAAAPRPRQSRAQPRHDAPPPATDTPAPDKIETSAPHGANLEAYAANLEAPAETPEPLRLTDEERAIMQAIRQGADTVDAVIDAVGQPTARVTASITMLELDGVLTRRGGKLYAAE